MEIENTLVLVTILALSGIGSGFVSGLLGIGGGSVLVPILFEVFGIIGVADQLRIHLAIGTSTAVIVPTTIMSAFSHNARGAVDANLVKNLSLPLVLGVFIGAIIAKYSQGDALIIVWIVFASFMAFYFAFGKESWRLSGSLPHRYILRLYGTFVGGLSTLLSIGGGVFVTSLMTLYGRPIQSAIATAATVGPIITIPAMIGFIWAGWNVPGLPPYSLGFVSVVGAAIIIPLSVLSAPLGVRLAHAMDKSKLKLLFALYLVLVVLRFSWNLIYS